MLPGYTVFAGRQEVDWVGGWWVCVHSLVHLRVVAHMLYLNACVRVAALGFVFLFGTTETFNRTYFTEVPQRSSTKGFADELLRLLGHVQEIIRFTLEGLGCACGGAKERRGHPKWPKRQPDPNSNFRRFLRNSSLGSKSLTRMLVRPQVP